MARKRFITSDMSTDERMAIIASENPIAALMWPWFLTGFDDWGRMDVTSPVKIKLELFPAFQFGADEIQKAIDFYVKVGIVYRYIADKKVYLAIEPCKYYKYQTYIRDKKRTEDKSNYPAPVNPPWDNCEHCRAVARTYADDNAEARNCIPSPSPSPSHSPSYNINPTSEQSPDTPQKTHAEEPEEPKKPKKQKKARETPSFDENTEQYKLALFMRQCIIENLPNAKVPEPTPDKLRRWAYDIDLMMRIDCRSPNQIRELIDWSHRDSFWKANILSPGKLREKWDTLVAHKKRAEEKIRGSPNKQIQQTQLPPQVLNFKQRQYTDDFYKKITGCP